MRIHIAGLFILAVVLMAGCSSSNAPVMTPDTNPFDTVSSGTTEREHAPPTSINHVAVRLNHMGDMKAWYTTAKGWTPVKTQAVKWITQCQAKANYWRSKGGVFADVNTTLIGVHPWKPAMACPIDKANDQTAVQICAGIGLALIGYNNPKSAIYCRRKP